MSYYDGVDVSMLVGETVARIDGKVGDEALKFHLANGRVFVMSHRQDCCESVTVEDICGCLEDLTGTPILQAECVESKENPPGYVPDYQDSFTWTFYKFATIKGYVTIRWYGESNGYYSESVDCWLEEANEDA